MASIRAVGNFYRLSCQRQDENELLVSAFRLVNLDITQASPIIHTDTHTYTHTHYCTLHFPRQFELSSAEEQRCTWVRFMILQVLLCVRSTNCYFNAFQSKVMDFSCHLY